MAKLPGYCGYPVVGDTSIEFYRDPEEYISKRIRETSSKIFQCRFLNYKTVFVCSYDGARELLEEKWEDFEHGYKPFLFNSFGDNILFENGTSASHLRKCMLPVFNDFAKCEGIVMKICETFFSSFLSQGTVLTNVYETFKVLMTKLCLKLFLDFDDNNSEISESISALTTLHWHGIISLPISMKVPFAGESGWRKAIIAKEKLLLIIKDRLKQDNDTFNESNSVFASLLSLPFKNKPKDIEQHILLFISALIPKAFSSIITSFILNTSGELKKGMRQKAVTNNEYLQRVLTEVQRLWPPFFGGRRVTVRDTNLGGYHIPKGYAVVYVSHHAHRDENFFKNPNAFEPNRWANCDVAMLAAEQTFTFGRGPRQCIGHRLINNILLHITSVLARNYDWDIVNNVDKKYKMLPVSRPAEQISVNFVPK